MFSGIEQTSRSVVHELRHPHDHPVEEEQRRRARVQRVRSVLQTARRQQAVDDEKRRHPDEKEETEEAAFVVVVLVGSPVRRGKPPAVHVRRHRTIGYVTRPAMPSRRIIRPPRLRNVTAGRPCTPRPLFPSRRYHVIILPVDGSVFTGGR